MGFSVLYLRKGFGGWKISSNTTAIAQASYFTSEEVKAQPEEEETTQCRFGQIFPDFWFLSTILLRKEQELRTESW